ncbi:hypothetical protein ACMD2_18898 [Ananas comosus]|uniref:Uncharacterized protein n=1 Tax=Ananas comosus TaxID=4615 RepID=A0A199VV01_ANACO|nr:hypothetical protein ACMD2_18898 [Ananas comosus]
MFSTISENPKSPLHIKQDNKFYSKLLSKENSSCNNSFRVYFGVASGSVPFLWESEPGTPKDTLPTKSKTSTPITPPPSNCNIHPEKTVSKRKKKSTRYLQFGLIASLFRELGRLRKLHMPYQSSAPSSSSFSSSSKTSDRPFVTSFDLVDLPAILPDLAVRSREGGNVAHVDHPRDEIRKERARTAAVGLHL